MTIAEAFKVFGTALNVEFTNEQSVAEVLSAIAVRFGGTAKQTIADAANEIAKVADHITAIGDATLVTKSITDNGTYNATSDEADGYSIVTVEVPSVEFSTTPNTFTLLTNISNLNVVIPDGLTSIGENAFNGCTGLTSIEIPSSVTNISNNAFNGCTGLTSVEIPSSVTNIGNNVFANCTNLATITIHKAEGSITGAPWGATNATVIWTG